MKITKEKLMEIIKEEVEKTLQEDGHEDDAHCPDETPSHLLQQYADYDAEDYQDGKQHQGWQFILEGRAELREDGVEVQIAQGEAGQYGKGDYPEEEVDPSGSQVVEELGLRHDHHRTSLIITWELDNVPYSLGMSSMKIISLA